MAYFWRSLLLQLVLLSFLGVAAVPQAAPPRLSWVFRHIAFADGFVDVYGGENVQKLRNGMLVNISLTRSSGSGFKSRADYYYGFFSAGIKLPVNYSAGVVVAFYLSNAEVFSRNHDEIDFEFLGHIEGDEWVLQTNLYGNGSVGTGREERFHFWFDPAATFHEYSIIWNHRHIVFLVDDVPVREVNHSAAMAGAFPGKPMSLYATIWDGSAWATRGGTRPVDYAYAPFVASFAALEMEGCAWNRTAPGPGEPPCPGGVPVQRLGLRPVDGRDFVELSPPQRAAMERARGRFMFYSYCRDGARYSVMPPECGEGKRRLSSRHNK
ncbi:unnamed protein product [Spirodela intermedia]|uniref:Xyloglucan endotransglucosylase/hydrolase n=1 Tax=Spirodela intermedia TaxID=51605 RepID=A0A7I8LEJ4_SPIIN|nr:unnamed protein product [Spirodela intermedia]